MNDDDLLARQREALLAFRQAGQERKMAEDQARRDLDSVQRKATEQQRSAQTQLESGKSWLRKVGLLRALQKSQVFSPGKARQSPAEALAQWVARAQQAARDLETSIEERRTFQNAVGAASRAKRHASQAEESAAEAEHASQSADDAWETIRPIRKRKAAAYFVYRIESARQEAAGASEEAKTAARKAVEAANRAQTALSSSDSVAAAARATTRAETQAQAAGRKAVEAAKTAWDVADEAKHAAGRAIDAVQAAARAWRLRIFVLAMTLSLIVLAAVVALHFFAGAP